MTAIVIEYTTINKLICSTAVRMAYIIIYNNTSLVHVCSCRDLAAGPISKSAPSIKHIILYTYIISCLLCTARVIDLFNWFETLVVTFRDLNIDNIMTCLYYMHTHPHRPNTCNRRLTAIIIIVISKKITVRRLPI